MNEVVPPRGERLRRNSGNLSTRETEHFNDADAPRKRFEDLFHEVEWLGAGEPDGSGLVRRVDYFLDIEKKLRRFLDLVDENGWTVAPEKECGVFLRSLQDGGVVESYLGAFDACRRISFHEVPEHSGLADLTRAGQDNDFEMFGISAN